MQTMPLVRPYYIPADFDWDSLAESAKVAVVQLCDSLYHELVLKAQSPVERLQGAQACFLAFLLVLSQCRVGEELQDAMGQGSGVPIPSEESLRNHLRLATSQQRATAFLFKVREYFRTKEPQDPLPLDAISPKG